MVRGSTARTDLTLVEILGIAMQAESVQASASGASALGHSIHRGTFLEPTVNCSNLYQHTFPPSFRATLTAHCVGRDAPCTDRLVDLGVKARGKVMVAPYGDQYTRAGRASHEAGKKKRW
jgi:hypothetical protein